MPASVSISMNVPSKLIIVINTLLVQILGNLSNVTVMTVIQEMVPTVRTLTNVLISAITATLMPTVTTTKVVSNVYVNLALSETELSVGIWTNVLWKPTIVRNIPPVRILSVPTTVLVPMDTNLTITELFVMISTSMH